MAAAAVDDQEASELRPTVLAANGPAAQVVLVIRRASLAVVPEVISEVLPAGLDVAHTGLPVRIVEGPTQEASGAQAKAARHEEVAHGLELTVEAGNGSVEVPVATTANPVAFLLATPPGPTVSVTRRTAKPPTTMATAG